MFNTLTGLLSFLSVCGVTLIAGSAKYPVILVPGDGGSQLWHKYDADDYFTSLWLNPIDISFDLDTVLKKLTTHFDNRTGRTDDGPNQTIHACFGNQDFLTSLLRNFAHLIITQEECDGKVEARLTENGFDFDTFRDTVTEMVEQGKVSIPQLELAAHSLQSGHECAKCAEFNKQERTPGCKDELGTPQDTILGTSQDNTLGNMGGAEQKMRVTTDSDSLTCPNLSKKADTESCLQCIGDIIGDIVKKITDLWRTLRNFKAVVEMLQQQGYTLNKDIRGAPYDFRKAPNELQDYYSNLTKLIEATSATNDDSPVVVVAHSFGNPVMHYFYNSVTTQAWRDRYIRAHVALSPPWAGAVKMVKVITSGENFHVPWANILQCRTAERSWLSSIWLMPCVLCKVWDPTQPFVVTATRNYTVTDYRQLFEDLNFTQGYDMWGWLQRTASVSLTELPKIGELHVLYGTDVPTASQIVFSPGAFPDGEPTIQYSNEGDGTVNLHSMEVFKHVAPPSNMIVKHQAFSKVDHTGVLSDQGVLDYLVRLLTSDRHG